jgi:hypothetical protein
MSQLKFGDIIEDYQRSSREFEDFLLDKIGLTDWSTISYNEEWCRLNIYGVEDSNRISQEGIKLLKTEHAVFDVVLHHKNGINTYCNSGWRIDRTRTIEGKFIVNFCSDNNESNYYIIKEDL